MGRSLRTCRLWYGIVAENGKTASEPGRYGNINLHFNPYLFVSAAHRGCRTLIILFLSLFREKREEKKKRNRRIVRRESRGRRRRRRGRERGRGESPSSHTLTNQG
jgi:hypothetical protein